MPGRDRRDQRPELYPLRVLRKPGERGPQLQTIPVSDSTFVGQVVGAVQAGVARVLDRTCDPAPALPADTLLPLDHVRAFKHPSPFLRKSSSAPTTMPPKPQAQ